MKKVETSIGAVGERLQHDLAGWCTKGCLGQWGINVRKNPAQQEHFVTYTCISHAVKMILPHKKRYESLD